MNFQIAHDAIAHQIEPAATFASENADRVNKLSVSLLKAASQFMDGVGKHHFSVDVIGALARYHEAEDLISYQALLRKNPVTDAGAIARYAFWELNDAISFLGDAIGTNWKYITMIERTISLDHADEALKAFDFLIANLDAVPSTVLSFAA
jgi:hypothetical protein